jgi:rhamnopyranosyl-N-acetylglucosaminyl-diphospho-decaprenol beta-1,3/1,4-galactofuranosyltransferase
MSACAVVVTHNRRDLLVRCIHALLAQTAPVEELVVVDNASTDGTRDLLAERGLLERVRYVRLAENAGSAGGFAAGVEAVSATAAGWIWLMDDDAEPEADCLERLLASPAADESGTAALCPAVVRPGGGIDLGHRGRFRGRPRPLPLEQYVPGSAPGLDYFTFVGVLLRASVARAAGPPRAELFIWADDYEYSFRVREHGSIRLVPDAHVLHRDVGQAHSSRRSRFWNRLTGWSYGPTPLEAFWRNLCGVRNFVWVRKRYEGQGAAGAWLTIAQFAVKSLLYDPAPLRRIPWIVRYGRAGRRGDFTNISPADWARLARDGRLVREALRPRRSAAPRGR